SKKSWWTSQIKWYLESQLTDSSYIGPSLSVILLSNDTPGSTDNLTMVRHVPTMPSVGNETRFHQPDSIQDKPSR
ncbi:hypothetical protein PISMIDRAFT_93809, partial [Pisolithus microcarpus 441]